MTDIVCACMAPKLELKLVDEEERRNQPKPKSRKEALARIRRSDFKPTEGVSELPRNKREAKKLGWEETEYGWLCPQCVEKQAAQEALDEQEAADSEDDHVLMDYITNAALTRMNRS